MNFIQKAVHRRSHDYIELFPYLREPVIENSTRPELVIYNRTADTTTTTSIGSDTDSTTSVTAVAIKKSEHAADDAFRMSNDDSSIVGQYIIDSSAIEAALGAAAAAANNASININRISNNDVDALSIDDLRKDEFIYSAGKIFGIRLRFKKPQERDSSTVSNAAAAAAAAIGQNWILNITAEYRFLKKENFKNDGRLIPGSFCDYYFFENTDAHTKSQTLDIWQYFHSPRFPANYPAHIKCAYKFLGRPESRVEIVFEELHVPKQNESCGLDKLSIFDSESTNTHKIDVICDSPSSSARRIISSGPDLLIEFDASSNQTAKGFRGKFKFFHNEVIETTFMAGLSTEPSLMPEKLIGLKHPSKYTNSEDNGKLAAWNGKYVRITIKGNTTKNKPINC